MSPLCSSPRILTVAVQIFQIRSHTLEESHEYKQILVSHNKKSSAIIEHKQSCAILHSKSCNERLGANVRRSKKDPNYARNRSIHADFRLTDTHIIMLRGKAEGSLNSGPSIVRPPSLPGSPSSKRKARKVVGPRRSAPWVTRVTSRARDQSWYISEWSCMRVYLVVVVSLDRFISK